jgi:hypothetical protein
VTTQWAARRALKKILFPLSGLAAACGLSLREVNSLLREGAVRSAVARQLERNARINISGIAAMTGISRGEISRILKTNGSDKKQATVQGEGPIDRVLIAWRKDPRFMTARGRPKALKVYGRGPTFESLVKAYGRGIPIRAFFDELTRVGAIEMRASKEIILKKTWAFDRRNAIKDSRAIFAAVSEIFSSALEDIREPVGAGISEVRQRVWTATMPLMKEKSLVQAREIFLGLQNVLTPYKTVHLKSTKSAKSAASLTVTAAFTEASEMTAKLALRARRNLRRNA